MAVLGHHHGSPIPGQDVDVGVPALQIADKGQSVGHVQKQPDIRLRQIRVGADELLQLEIFLLRNPDGGDQSVLVHRLHHVAHDI